MSETRPPITAGPIARALRFLKRTSVSCGAPEDGAGVTDADNCGTVLAGDAAGDAGGGDSSCPNAVVLIIKSAKIKGTRVVIEWRGNDDNLLAKGKHAAIQRKSGTKPDTLVAFAPVKMRVSSSNL